ncbi:DUF5000 domain-containing lipoprotein [Pedobacter nyackensis]|uniref:DUF5000 domain-containing lipoprotein n=1 Tax=Pedobacter nyackensis TaxID=475255 RepID=UPI0029319127|nr:DUF5000 domain-containing lipoprotein [Pedobacter nyackensis]
MKNIINKFSVLLVIIALGTFGCKSDILNGPIENSAEKPGPVTNVSVVNKSGGALLTYTLPGNEGLSYIKAEYEIRPGVKREVVSSYYTNELLIDGFNSTDEREITLYSVTRSEVKSDPIKIKIKPLKSPIQNVYESLKVVAGFGGPNIKFANTDKLPITIVPLMKIKTGELKGLDKIYSQSALGNITIRGLEPVLTKFGFVVTDRFGNHTDTLYQDLTPYSEIKLDKTKFSLFTLPGDAKPAYPEALLTYLWDNNYPTTATWPRAFTTEGAITPQTITIDLGVTTALSRFVFFPRTETGGKFYVRANLREYEIWATNNPTADGSYNNWTLISTAAVIKPSGLPAGTETAEDLAYALKGWSTEFEPGLPAFRYFRIKSLRNWENNFAIMAAQIDIYGSK